jgi:hypothetical protein
MTARENFDDEQSLSADPEQVLRYMLLIARSVEVFTKWRRALDAIVAIIRVSISRWRRSSSQALARQLLVRRLMGEG